MHIVFIVGSYFPYYSAVGKCVGNVADELAKEHKITVICQKKYTEQEDVEFYNNQKIVRVNIKENEIRHRLNKNIESKNALKRDINKFFLNCYKLSRIIKTIFSSVSINRNLVNSYINALNKIEEPIDVVIPASMPFESVVAASKYLIQNDAKPIMIPYLFDQFVANKSLHRAELNMRIKQKNHSNLEKNTLEDAKSILIMNQLGEHFESKFVNYDKKFNVVEHPLLKAYSNKFDNIKNIISGPGGLKIVYTGSFYKKIRNPEYFLKVAEKALVNLNANLDLYTFGNCNDIINKYTNRINSIINHGQVSTDKAYEAISNANLLIAVGNSDNNQVPSKIFEYLSFGKPIVYFYSNDSDVNLEILKKYPLFLALKQDYEKLDENVNLFKDFCEKHSNSRVPFEEVERLFKDATPQYTADLIMQLISGAKTDQ